MGFYIALLCSLFHSAIADPEVTLKGGSLEGTKVIGDIKGKEVKAEVFQGIPYAQPPIRSLRFALPRAPKKPADGKIIAKAAKTNCVQLNISVTDKLQDRDMSEDCLYLNIYRPIRDPKKTYPAHPVLVYIQGKGFESDSKRLSNDKIIENIVSKGIIFVTLKYRLNIFGFPDGPGFRRNLGLLDQVAALNWLQDNLQAFGGNKNKVTLMGHDSGASAVNYHLHSHASLGLFQQAIMASGTRLDKRSNQDAAPKKNFNATGLVAAKHAKSNCRFQQDLPHCLQNLENGWKTLRDSTYNVTMDIKCCPWSPLEDIYSAPSNPTKDSSAMKERNNIPILMGNTKAELLQKVIGKYKADKLETAKIRFDDYAKRYSKEFNDDADSKLIDINKAYRPTKPESNVKDWIKAAEKMTSGRVKLAGTIKEARELSQNTKKLYLYSFDYDSDKSGYPWPRGFHLAPSGLDVDFLFGQPNFEYSSTDKAIVNVLSGIFTSFVKNGEPEVNGVKFPKIGSNYFMSIAETSSSKPNYAMTEDEVWNNYHRPQATQDRPDTL